MHKLIVEQILLPMKSKSKPLNARGALQAESSNLRRQDVFGNWIGQGQSGNEAFLTPDEDKNKNM